MLMVAVLDRARKQSITRLGDRKSFTISYRLLMSYSSHSVQVMELALVIPENVEQKVSLDATSRAFY